MYSFHLCVIQISVIKCLNNTHKNMSKDGRKTHTYRNNYNLWDFFSKICQIYCLKKLTFKVYGGFFSNYRQRVAKAFFLSLKCYRNDSFPHTLKKCFCPIYWLQDIFLKCFKSDKFFFLTINILIDFEVVILIIFTNDVKYQICFR